MGGCVCTGVKLESYGRDIAMAMTTRCPHCSTAFKVVPDQLRVRNGLVRCGECATVFDGRACLVAQVPQGFERSPVSAASFTPDDVPKDSPAPAVLRSRSDIAKQGPYLSELAPDTLGDDDWDTKRLSAYDERDSDHVADGPDDFNNADSTDAVEDNDPSIVRGEARTRYYGATDVGRAPPEFLDTDHQAHRSFLRSVWGYACVLGLLVLGAQLIFVYRSNIAEMSPELRPLLVRLCEPLGCNVGYMRHIDRISITSSSLQPPAGQGGASEQTDASTLVLRASLRNLYDQPQPWPALRLDLSDLSDTVVIRKVLLPEAYLPKGQAQQPFEAGAELNIAVPIEINGARVNGFQLHKFFP